MTKRISYEEDRVLEIIEACRDLDGAVSCLSHIMGYPREWPGKDEFYRKSAERVLTNAREYRENVPVSIQQELIFGTTSVDFWEGEARKILDDESWGCEEK